MPSIDIDAEGIPDELRELRNWICWREGERDGKRTKVPTKPYRTSGSINLDVTDPEQRREFETAWESLNDSRVTADGLGFVFTEEVGVVGIDLDGCRDAETGEVAGWALDIVKRVGSYTEVSPSGTGVHILARGALPPGGNRRGSVEMYDTDRYFTVTGVHVEGTPTQVRERQEAIEAVHHEWIQSGASKGSQARLGTSSESDESGRRSSRRRESGSGQRVGVSLRERYGDALSEIREPAVREALGRVATKYLPERCPRTFDDLAGPGVELSDEELLERMFASKGGDRRRRLYEGDASMWGSFEADYPSQSEADMALAHTLAFWTGKDPGRMDALFRASGLYREKWDRKHYASGATYGGVTLARALLRVDDYYDPPSRDGSSASNGGDSGGDGAGGGGRPPMEFETGGDGEGTLHGERLEEEGAGFGRDGRHEPGDSTSGRASTDTNIGSDVSAGESAPGSVRPASPHGTDTDPGLDESTQRMMEASARAAGDDWARTNPRLEDDEKHPSDWTVGPIEGRTPTAQAMRLAREDNRVLARYQSRLEQRLARLSDVESDRDRYRFTAEVYLKAMDELMREREQYRRKLRRAGLLSVEEAALPDDPVEWLTEVVYTLVDREGDTTPAEAATGIDAVLREYEQENEQARRGVRDRLSRLFD